MKRMGIAVAALVLAGLAAGAAYGQAPYPSRPIKILVPYAPGGATDYAARLVTEKAKLALGANIVIENRTGAGGIVAMEEMVRAKPDGYTLMIGNVSTNAITPLIAAKNMTINYERDVTVVARLLVTPSVFTLNAEFPARSFPEFIDYTRKYPGKVRYASTGIASFPHFDMETMARRLGLDMVHIPYKGGAGDAIKGLASGDVHVGSTNSVLGLSLAKSGKIVLVANNMPQRMAMIPDVPTFAELGLPGHGTLNWSALFAPSGTPPEIVKALHKAFTEAARDSHILEQAEKSGTFGFTADTVEATADWLKDEMAKWRRIIADTKIDLN